MADQNLGITGRDVQIVISLNGVPMDVIDAVITFSATPILGGIRQKHLGTSNVDVDVDPEGWKGECEVTVKNGVLDEFIDALQSFIRNRIPKTLSFNENIHYRDLSSARYTYPDCQIMDASRIFKRGDATTYRLGWETGKNRIRS